ncbi:MAG: cell wall-associated protease, partial [Psychroserpens sp.]
MGNRFSITKANGKIFFQISLIFYGFALFTIINCKSSNVNVNSTEQVALFVEPKSKQWFTEEKSSFDDVDIGLQQCYSGLLSNKNPNNIIVAIIDSEIDLNHKDLKGSLWLNKDEIPNNGIDDDNNGYIDDVHGWNFLGDKYGKNTEFVNREETRILRSYKNYFKDKDISKLNQKDSLAYLNYLSVKTEFENLVLF